jgi:hypothetical protein
MPLNTEVHRNGKLLKLNWDYTTLSCMMTAAFKEEFPEEEFAEGRTYGSLKEGQWVDFTYSPLYYIDPAPSVLSKGRQTLKNRHVFQIAEDEELVFEAGDVLRAWRSHK